MNFLEYMWLMLAVIAGLGALVYTIDLVMAAARNGMDGANIVFRLVIVGLAVPACGFFLSLAHLVSIG